MLRSSFAIFLLGPRFESRSGPDTILNLLLRLCCKALMRQVSTYPRTYKVAIFCNNHMLFYLLTDTLIVLSWLGLLLKPPGLCKLHLGFFMCCCVMEGGGDCWIPVGGRGAFTFYSCPYPYHYYFKKKS